MTESWFSYHKQYARFPTILLWIMSYMRLRQQRLVFRRHPSGAPLTAARKHAEDYFPNWSSSSIYNITDSRFSPWKKLFDLQCSKTSLCGHLSKVDTSVLWTPLGPPELFLLEMNLSNVDTSLFWTVDTFYGLVCSKQPLESGHLL